MCKHAEYILIYICIYINILKCIHICLLCELAKVNDSNREEIVFPWYCQDSNQEFLGTHVVSSLNSTHIHFNNGLCSSMKGEVIIEISIALLSKFAQVFSLHQMENYPLFFTGISLPPTDNADYCCVCVNCVGLQVHMCFTNSTWFGIPTIIYFWKSSGNQSKSRTTAATNLIYDHRMCCVC